MVLHICSRWIFPDLKAFLEITSETHLELCFRGDSTCSQGDSEDQQYSAFIIVHLFVKIWLRFYILKKKSSLKWKPHALPKAMPGARSPSKAPTLCLPQFFRAHWVYRQLHLLSSSPYLSPQLLQKPLATSEATTRQNPRTQLRQNPSTQPEVTPAIKSPGRNMGENPSTKP